MAASASQAKYGRGFAGDEQEAEEEDRRLAEVKANWRTVG